MEENTEVKLYELDNFDIEKILSGKNSRLDLNPSCRFYITKIEDNYIKGYIAHTNHRKGKYHMRQNTGYNYFNNYQKNIPVYFSFNGNTFYQLDDIFKPENIDYPVILTLKKIDIYKINN